MEMSFHISSITSKYSTVPPRYFYRAKENILCTLKNYACVSVYGILFNSYTLQALQPSVV